MQFVTPLVPGKILKRYKRFLADVVLSNGEMVTAHTPNTGSMQTCWEPHWNVLLSKSSNPTRKLPYTLEMTHNGQSWIGVNTHLPNKLAIEAINDGTIAELTGYDSIRSEYKIGESRIDLLLEKKNQKCFVEIKNVSMLGDNKPAIFPDSVSKRGLKHLHELTRLKELGHRACMLFIVQRQDVDLFSPAHKIDPEYAHGLFQAYEKGVEILSYQCQLNENEIKISNPIVYLI